MLKNRFEITHIFRGIDKSRMRVCHFFVPVLSRCRIGAIDIGPRMVGIGEVRLPSDASDVVLRRPGRRGNDLA
jgi:hypothetical protein